MKKAQKILSKDAKKYLNISVDLRTKAFRDFVTTHGGFESAIEAIQVMLNEIPEYKKKKSIRTKQIVVQKKYNETNKKDRYIGNIEVKYEIKVERTKRVKPEGTSNRHKGKLVTYLDSQIKTENIRFDKVISKKDTDDTIKKIVEERRRELLNKDNYVLSIQTSKFDYSIQKVNKGTNLENIKMKDASACMLDGYDNQEWDSKTGKCVLDYIIHHYKDIKGFKTALCSYESLNNILKNFEDEDCSITGVDTLQIMKFCMKHKISMYALNDDDKVFKIYQITDKNGRNRHAPSMMFKLSNNHFYPIPDDKKKSFLKTISIANSSSDLIITHTNNTKVKQPINNIIILENTEPMTELGKLINDNKIPSNIKMIDKNINSFNWKNNQYSINQNVELTKELTETMGIEYNGQSLGGLIGKIIEETIKVLPKSSHNPEVFNNLLIAKKDRAFGGLLQEVNHILLDNPNTTAFDITKCYTSVMYNPIEDWIKLDFNDNMEIYNEGDNIELGLYLVETEDTTLFKKSNIYSSSIIKKAMEETIEFKITHKLVSKGKENKVLFKSVIDKIVEYSDNDNEKYKLLINMLSGILGKSKSSYSYCFINKCVEQIFNIISTYEKLDKKIFINKIPNTEYFLYGIDNDVVLSETNIPMYIQILDQANIKVYDMIKEMGGVLIGRKVDCAIIHYPNGKPEEVPEASALKGLEWGSIRSCSIPKMDYVEDFKEKSFKFNNNWIDYNIKDSDDWKKIMNIMVDNRGLLLQSDAGNGKSYVAKNISKTLSNVKCIAPTNKAALNIKGSTIHKFIALNEEGNISKKKLETIQKKYKYIIVDEISMITKELWERLVLLKQATGITFLLIGDQKQLPPVEDENIEDYFNHPAVKYLTNNKRNILTIRKRFDERLYNYLKDVNHLDLSLFGVKKTTRNICYKNETRKYINKKWNNKLKPELGSYLELKEDPKDDYTQDMYIYIELPVIARKTIDKGEVCVNNETFEVINYDNESIYLGTTRPNDDGEPEPHLIDININDFIGMFSMNYCSTTHKSQGETIDEDFTIYEWEIMSEKCKYTALSRARKPEQVYIQYDPKTYKKLIKNKEIIKEPEFTLFDYYNKPIKDIKPIKDVKPSIKEIIYNDECYQYNKILGKYWDNSEWINENELFIKVINNKIKSHLKYDEEKGLIKQGSTITTEKVMKLYEKQNGECNICNCNMKRFNYKSNDGDQFSIDKVSPLLGLTDDNIQLLCWNCNRSKSNRLKNEQGAE